MYVKDALKRIPGVGDVVIFGERKYAMRIWLDPTKLAARQLTAADVVSALQEQNVEIPAGQLGRPPSDPKQNFQITLRVVGRLSEPKEFENIILKNTPNGIVQLKDVGRAEIGAESYDTNLLYSGHEAVGVGVQQLSNANALDVDKAAKAELIELSKSFPPGIKYVVAFDTTTVVGDSVKEVVTTLEEAILIVIVVIFIFLLDWRATIIPAVTIPVSLIGTFAFIKIFELLDQFADAVRHHAGDGAGGRRRHRGDRKRAAAHQPGQDRSAQSHFRGHGGSVERRGRHFAGADFGIRAGVVFPGHHGNSLQAIFADHRVLHRHLAVQRAYAFARAGGHPVARRGAQVLRVRLDAHRMAVERVPQASRTASTLRSTAWEPRTARPSARC